ncbi:SIR2 family protein [Pseudomonas sp. LB3P31]
MSTHATTISEVASLINSGKAILFAGAGFSSDTINIENIELPRASALARKICALGEFGEDDDLRYASQHYIKKNKSIEQLINLLKTTFTCKKTTPAQESIVAAPWRRIYTTNYDNAIEQAGLQTSKLVETVDISCSPHNYVKKSNLCIHLNGSTSSLTPDTLNTTFKLSAASYISADGFLNSPWSYQFKRDLDTCTALVFIGYSLYDIEIQKILYENSDLKRKTYFVTQIDPSEKSLSVLEDYGTVLPVGVDYFGEQIAGQVTTQLIDPDILSALERYEPSQASRTIRDKDVDGLILHGSTEQDLVDLSILTQQPVPYMIKRKELEILDRFLLANRHTVISSSFGNGKTLLLKEALPFLSTRGYDVYTIADPSGDFEGDIEKIRGNRKSVIIIDDYSHHPDLIKTIGLLQPENILTITSTRFHAHERLRDELKQHNFSYQELSIDELSIEEIEQLIAIFDNLGAWGDKAYMSRQQKISYVLQENDAQISLALLALFDSPQIKDRVKNLLNFFPDLSSSVHKSYRDTAFAIALIEVIGLQTTNSFISEIALNDEIYSDKLRSNESFKQLFKPASGGVQTRSSLFCMSLIKNHFPSTYIKEQLLRIAQKYGRLDKKSQEENEAFRSLVKFSFIERLLPDANKKSNIRDYYEKLKTNVDWLKSDPHFWLQYAMAHIPFKEYEKAQQYIDQSYALAKKKLNYHTNHHDTQQGRLYLLMALEPATLSRAPELFSKGHQLFCKIDNDIFKFRQLGLYSEYYDICYSKISKRHQTEFEHACKRMATDAERLINELSDTTFNTPFMLRALERLNKTIALIKDFRKVK